MASHYSARPLLYHCTYLPSHAPPPTGVIYYHFTIHPSIILLYTLDRKPHGDASLCHTLCCPAPVPEFLSGHRLPTHRQSVVVESRPRRARARHLMFVVGVVIKTIIRRLLLRTVEESGAHVVARHSLIVVGVKTGAAAVAGSVDRRTKAAGGRSAGALFEEREILKDAHGTDGTNHAHIATAHQSSQHAYLVNLLLTPKSPRFDIRRPSLVVCLGTPRSRRTTTSGMTGGTVFFILVFYIGTYLATYARTRRHTSHCFALLRSAVL